MLGMMTCSFWSGSPARTNGGLRSRVTVTMTITHL
jgi:hypothetical protein